MSLLYNTPGHHERNRILQAFLLTVWLGAWIQQTAGEILLVPDVVNPVVGTTVNLSIHVTGPILHFVWYRGKDPGNEILSYTPGCDPKITHGSKYTRRETAHDDGHLQIESVQIQDTGIYTVILQVPGRILSATGEIQVYESFLEVELRRNGTSQHLWENEDAVWLNCTTWMPNLTFTWTFNGGPLPQSPRYKLSSDNSSLTITLIHRGDNGAFACVAANAAINQTSNMEISVSWRPNFPIKCAAKPSGESHVSLSCSWQGGNPSASIHMKHLEYNETGYDEVIGNVSWNSSFAGTEMACYGNQEGETQNCSLLLDVPSDPGFLEGRIYSTTEGKDVFLEVNLKRNHQASLMDPLPATFKWFQGFINASSSITPGDKVVITSNTSYSQLRISEVKEDNSSNYHCQAGNLMGTTNFSFIVNVSKAPVIPVISTGAFSGIVVGTAAVLVLTGAATYFLFKRKKDTIPSDIGRSDPVKPRSDEPVYVNVKRIPDKIPSDIGRSDPVKPQSDEPVYVNVKRISEEPKYETLIPNSDTAVYANVKRN